MDLHLGQEALKREELAAAAEALLRRNAELEARVQVYMRKEPCQRALWYTKRPTDTG